MAITLEALAVELVRLKTFERRLDEAFVTSAPRCGAGQSASRIAADMDRVAIRRQAIISLMAFLPPETPQDALIAAIIAIAHQDRLRTAYTERDSIDAGCNHVRLETVLIGLLKHLESGTDTTVENLGLSFLVQSGWRGIPRS